MGYPKTSKRKQNSARRIETNKSESNSDKGTATDEILVDKGSSSDNRSQKILDNFDTALEKLKNILVDSISVSEGQNEIRIELHKKHNRVYKIQIYFNNVEVSPSQYTGTSSAMNYWKLLKGLKK